jgi:hypothetical protein
VKKQKSAVFAGDEKAAGVRGTKLSQTASTPSAFNAAVI